MPHLSKGGSPRCRRITTSTPSSEMLGPWAAISFSTITAGAAGRPEARCASPWYSSLDLVILTTSRSYFAPNLGMISCSRFQVRPQGSFINTLTFSMVVLLIKRYFLPTAVMRLRT